MLRVRSLAVVAGLVLLIVIAGCSSKKSSTDTTDASSSPNATELEKWQKDLNIVGCWAGPVDGKLGAETEHAIKQFQTAEKLTADGKLGPQTEAALTKAAEEGKEVCGKHHSEFSPAELEKWQRDLNIVGCWAGPVDGKLGPATEHAIKQFQTAEKLTVDGMLGPQTEASLTKAAADKRKVCSGGNTPTPTHTAAPTSTHSAGPSPACTMDLLTAAAKTHHGASFKQMHAFECAQPWATASVELTNGTRTQDLFKADKSAWAWTDRSGPCAKKEVPASIRTEACA